MSWTKAASSSTRSEKIPDPTDPRLGETIASLTLETLDALVAPAAPSWTLLGYPDDEGIAMNGGRPGAKEAPDRIRKILNKLTPSLLNPAPRNIVDLGNLSTEVPLPDRHQRGRQIIAKAMSLGYKTLSLGGGHDYGYADGAGFLDACAGENQRPVLINFDAHLDVRPSDKGFHSGTPFRRLLTDFPNGFDFIEIGLQNQCNSFEHLKWAQAQGAKIILLEDIRALGLMALLQPMLASLAGRAAFVSVDIDAFASAEAPGCSQSWAGGLTFNEFTPALREIQKLLKVQGLGIYEVSPALDTDDRTSKLAALILHQTLFNS